MFSAQIRPSFSVCDFRSLGSCDRCHKRRISYSSDDAPALTLRLSNASRQHFKGEGSQASATIFAKPREVVGTASPEQMRCRVDLGCVYVISDSCLAISHSRDIAARHRVIMERRALFRLAVSAGIFSESASRYAGGWPMQTVGIRS